MSVVPWAIPATSATPAPAPAAPECPPPSGGMNAGTLLVLGILAAAIVQWVSGRQRAKQEEELARGLEARVNEAHFDLEGAREDEELSLAKAFAAHRPAVPGIGWGR